MDFPEARCVVEGAHQVFSGVGRGDYVMVDIVRIDAPPEAPPGSCTLAGMAERADY